MMRIRGTSQSLVIILLLLLGAGTGSAFDAVDLERIRNENRAALGSFDAEICRQSSGDPLLVQRERWVIAGRNLRYERSESSGAYPGSRAAGEMREAYTWDGTKEMIIQCERKRGWVNRTPSSSNSYKANNPSHLFGVEAVGLGDPAGWSKQGKTTLQGLPNGCIQMEITGEPIKLAIGRSDMPYKLYDRRSAVIDIGRGGTVLSVEDRNEKGEVLLSVENRDLIQTPGGAWVPRTTTLRKYANGCLVRSTELRVEKLQPPEGSQNSLFRLEFPKDYVVEDNIVGNAYVAGQPPDSMVSVAKDISLIPSSLPAAQIKTRATPLRGKTALSSSAPPRKEQDALSPKQSLPAGSSENQSVMTAPRIALIAVTILALGGGIWFLRKMCS